MDETTIKRIATEFNIKEESIAEMICLYGKVRKGIKVQYLAHLVRALEATMRRLTKNEFFRVIVRPISLDNVEIGQSKALYKKGRWDDKKKRVYIAHELGHLYLLSQKKAFGIRKNDDQTEPLATIFGMLAILDKDEFYLSIADRGLLHSNLEEVIKNFKEISHTE